jgi:hypothetical protein
VYVDDGIEEVFETNWELEVNKFDDMGLKESVLRGIYGYGFKDPSPIQQKGILPLIQGKDTIAQVSLQENIIVLSFYYLKPFLTYTSLGSIWYW